MGLRDGLDVLVMRNISCVSRDSNRWPSSRGSVVSILITLPRLPPPLPSQYSGKKGKTFQEMNLFRPSVGALDRLTGPVSENLSSFETAKTIEEVQTDRQTDCNVRVPSLEHFINRLPFRQCPRLTWAKKIEPIMQFTTFSPQDVVSTQGVFFLLSKERLIKQPK